MEEERKQENNEEMVEVTYLDAFNTASSELLLIAVGAVDLLLSRDETLGTNGAFAHNTGEAFIVPLAGFVFHFLGS